MRILIIGQGIPFPPLSGGEVRTYHLARALAARHQVTLVGFNCGKTRSLPPFSIRVHEQPWELPPLWNDMVNGEPHVWCSAYEQLLKNTDEPWFVSCIHSTGMEELLRQVAEEDYHLVIVNRTSMARFLPVLPPQVPRVLNLHVVHSLMAQRAAAGKTGADLDLALHEADRTLRFERLAARRCALCLTVSEPEAVAARTLLGIDHVQVIPNGVDTAAFTPGEQPPESGYLLFTGRLDSPPNIEAVLYFAKQVLPLVQREMPKVHFHVVGSNAGKEVQQLASDHVIVHGPAPDLAPYYRRAAVVVMPLLNGGGTRHQLLEAGACARAIVSTPRGVEGLEFSTGEDLLMAEGPADFAAAVVRLLRDERQSHLLGQRARRVCRQYEWDKIGSQFCHLIENLVKPVSLSKPHRLASPHGAAVSRPVDNARVMS
jgi:glycosyltransferase involved in cell wall biosynthesis